VVVYLRTRFLVGLDRDLARENGLTRGATAKDAQKLRIMREGHRLCGWTALVDAVVDGTDVVGPHRVEKEGLLWHHQLLREKPVAEVEVVTIESREEGLVVEGILRDEEREKVDRDPLACLRGDEDEVGGDLETALLQKELNRLLIVLLHGGDEMLLRELDLDPVLGEEGHDVLTTLGGGYVHGGILADELTLLVEDLDPLVRVRLVAKESLHRTGVTLTHGGEQVGSLLALRGMVATATKALVVDLVEINLHPLQVGVDDVSLTILAVTGHHDLRLHLYFLR